MGLFHLSPQGVSYEEYQLVLDELAEATAALNAPTEWLEAVMTKRVVVHTKNDLTFDGSLMARMDDGIVLRAAKLLEAEGRSTALPGETWVPRDNIAFVQLDG